MKLIPLTQGQFSKVDDKIFKKLKASKWYALFSKNMNSFYAVRGVL